MKKIEKYLSIAIALGVILRLSQLPGGSILLILGSLPLSVVYFFLGWKLFSENIKNPTTLIIAGFAGMVLAVLLLGNMFKFQIYPGGITMLRIILLPGLGLLIISKYLSLKTHEKNAIIFQNIYKRIFILLPIGVVLFYLTEKQMYQLRNWSDPKLAELKYLRHIHPDSKEHIKNLEDYLENQ